MPAENELPSVPTEALAIYEPFVQWLLTAPPEELMSLPDGIISSISVTIEDDEEAEAVDVRSLDTTQEERWPQFDNVFNAQLALAEAEVELENVWDLSSCAQREWSTLDEKLLDLQDEHDESCEAIALLERRIIKLLQDRDLAIAETYTTEKQIQDAEFFKMRQQQRRQQEEEEQKKARVASALRRLLLRRSSTESDEFSASPPSSPAQKLSEKDVHRLQKELADSKVAAALAKAELDERRNALRRAERQFADVKLTLAQAQTEEDDLQTSLQQLARARRSSVDQLQQISLFSAAALPLEPPPAPTASRR